MTHLTRAADIAAELNTRLNAITQANGCETDVGLRVYRGRKNVDESLVPCAVIIEGADDPQDRPGRLPSALIRQRYVLAAYTACDPDHPNDAAHAAIRDLKRAVFKDGGTLGNRVPKISYAGRDIGPRLDGYPAVFVTVTIDVEFVEDLTHP